MNKFLLGLVITLMMTGSGYTKNFEKRVNQELIVIFEVSYKEDIEVTAITSKAKGTKCPVCWKISESPCPRHS